MYSVPDVICAALTSWGMMAGDQLYLKKRQDVCVLQDHENEEHSLQNPVTLLLHPPSTLTFTTVLYKSCRKAHTRELKVLWVQLVVSHPFFSSDNIHFLHFSLVCTC